MFEPFEFEDRIIGHLVSSTDHLAFFGNRHGSLDVLKQAFPKWKFWGIQQVHSSRWVPASQDSNEADAHYTHKAGKALYIKTADCVPILINTPTTVAAIHAGWRGVAGGIILRSETRTNLFGEGSQAYIGPHIGLESFEVGNEVVNEILQSPGLGKMTKEDFCQNHPDPNKSFVNLSAIINQQLRQVGISTSSQMVANTFLDSEYHSYRRDGDSAGRQISFIVRL